MSIAQRLDEVDEADEDTLDRILWFAARGRDDTNLAWAVLSTRMATTDVNQWLRDL